VFAAMHDLVPEFVLEHVMADFEEASVADFQKVSGSITVSGCWFHHSAGCVEVREQAWP